jgi:hypothetical protein
VSARRITVDLPAPEGPDGDGQLFFADYELRVDLTGPSGEPAEIRWNGRLIDAFIARNLGLELLAAAETAENGHPDVRLITKSR